MSQKTKNKEREKKIIINTRKVGKDSMNRIANKHSDSFHTYSQVEISCGNSESPS